MARDPRVTGASPAASRTAAWGGATRPGRFGLAQTRRRCRGGSPCRGEACRAAKAGGGWPELLSEGGDGPAAGRRRREVEQVQLAVGKLVATSDWTGGRRTRRIGGAKVDDGFCSWAAALAGSRAWRRCARQATGSVRRSELLSGSTNLRMNLPIRRSILSISALSGTGGSGSM